MENKADFYKKISDQIGLEVNDDTLFFEKVGISGFDATMFIKFIQENYDVDFSSFRHSDYYVEDGKNIFRLILNHWFEKEKFPSKQFTGLHLFNVVNAGFWFDQ